FAENGPSIDQVVYLQPYEEGWGDEYKLKYDRRPCIDGSRFYQQRADGSWRGWFFSYEEVHAKKFECISIQGDSATFKDLIISEYPTQSVRFLPSHSALRTWKSLSLPGRASSLIEVRRFSTSIMAMFITGKRDGACVMPNTS
ncbi:hypothetical protein OSTOST_24801, partial [Ostertagia ostertagi]